MRCCLKVSTSAPLLGLGRSRFRFLEAVEVPNGYAIRRLSTADTAIFGRHVCEVRGPTPAGP
jgi:hypothetical protein